MKTLKITAIVCGALLYSSVLLAMVVANEVRKLERDCSSWGWTYCVYR